MEVGGIIEALPLWALYIITSAIVLLSAEAGWRLGNYRRQRPQHEKDAPVGAVVGATLGLLAFLLAFTFGMAASRYDTRKQLVLQEANAIGTTYLRADMLPEPQRSEIRNLLREYAALRVGGVTSLMTPEVMAQSGALHDRLWAQAVAVGGQSPNSIVGRALCAILERDDRSRRDARDGRPQPDPGCDLAGAVCRDHSDDGRDGVPVWTDGRA